MDGGKLSADLELVEGAEPEKMKKTNKQTKTIFPQIWSWMKEQNKQQKKTNKKQTNKLDQVPNLAICVIFGPF